MVILNDRYFWATLAYGYGLGLDMDWLTILQLKFPIPDESFYLKVAPEFCLERIKKSRLARDLFETENMLKRTETGYQLLLEKYSDHVTVLEGSQSPEVITEQMMIKLKENSKFKNLIKTVS